MGCCCSKAKVPAGPLAADHLESDFSSSHKAPTNRTIGKPNLQEDPAFWERMLTQLPIFILRFRSALMLLMYMYRWLMK